MKSRGKKLEQMKVEGGRRRRLYRVCVSHANNAWCSQRCRWPAWTCWQTLITPTLDQYASSQPFDTYISIPRATRPGSGMDTKFSMTLPIGTRGMPSNHMMVSIFSRIAGDGVGGHLTQSPVAMLTPRLVNTRARLPRTWQINNTQKSMF